MLVSQTQLPEFTPWSLPEKLVVVSQHGVILTVAENRDPASARRKRRTDFRSHCLNAICTLWNVHAAMQACILCSQSLIKHSLSEK